jgi:hypothetical protein
VSREAHSGRFTSTTLRMFSGVIIWAAHFTVIYGFTALACARGFAELQWLGVGIVPWTVGGATLIAVTATLVMGVPAARAARASFENWMTAGVAGLALIAIVWETWPVIMVPTCG